MGVINDQVDILPTLRTAIANSCCLMILKFHCITTSQINNLEIREISAFRTFDRSRCQRRRAARKWGWSVPCAWGGGRRAGQVAGTGLWGRRRGLARGQAVSGWRPGGELLAAGQRVAGGPRLRRAGAGLEGWGRRLTAGWGGAHDTGPPFRVQHTTGRGGGRPCIGGACGQSRRGHARTAASRPPSARTVGGPSCARGAAPGGRWWGPVRWRPSRGPPGIGTGSAGTGAWPSDTERPRSSR